MEKNPRGNIYAKNGYYYARISYYVDGKRKTKDKATGVAVDKSSKRKSNKQERAALQIMHELLTKFAVPGSNSEPNIREQLFKDTAQAWLEHQRGSKAPGTISSYSYIVRDIVLYFDTITPVRTADLTTTQVETYLTWERNRRQPSMDRNAQVIGQSLILINSSVWFFDFHFAEVCLRNTCFNSQFLLAKAEITSNNLNDMHRLPPVCFKTKKLANTAITGYTYKVTLVLSCMIAYTMPYINWQSIQLFIGILLQNIR
ncbi:MAG: hypothetical protein IKA16_03165 [Oscillospiraceae bacterium]|nr:hypothetical protein [Oscillospiraceae bacterium]